MASLLISGRYSIIVTARSLWPVSKIFVASHVTIVCSPIFANSHVELICKPIVTSVDPVASPVINVCGPILN